MDNTQNQDQKAAAAAEMRRKLALMTGGAVTVLVLEVKFKTREEWVNYLHHFRRNGGRESLLGRLPSYIVDEYHIFARATDAVGMYDISKSFDGVHLRSSYRYYIKLTLEGAPIMSTLGRQHVEDSLWRALNDILPGRPVSSAALI